MTCAARLTAVASTAPEVGQVTRLDRDDEFVQCTGRSKHEEPSQALTEAKAKEAETGRPWEVYMCPWCFWFHTQVAPNGPEIVAARERSRQDREDRRQHRLRLERTKHQYKSRTQMRRYWQQLPPSARNGLPPL
mgnify:CR=1 FL=1